MLSERQLCAQTHMTRCRSDSSFVYVIDDDQLRALSTEGDRAIVALQRSREQCERRCRSPLWRTVMKIRILLRMG